MLISFCKGTYVLNMDYVMSMQVNKTNEGGATEEIVIVFRDALVKQYIPNTRKALFQAVHTWMENPTQQGPSET